MSKFRFFLLKFGHKVKIYSNFGHIISKCWFFPVEIVEFLRRSTDNRPINWMIVSTGDSNRRYLDDHFQRIGCCCLPRDCSENNWAPAMIYLGTGSIIGITCGILAAWYSWWPLTPPRKQIFFFFLNNNDNIQLIM